MEVNKARGSDLHRDEASTSSNGPDKLKEDSDAGSSALKEQSSANNEEISGDNRKMERVGSVEYTRNANYDANGANGGIVQPDLQQSRFALWRAQADQDMIRCIKEDDTHHTYFTQPPVNPITLFFKDHLTEKDYRKKAWQPHKEERRPSYGQPGGLTVVGSDQGSPHHQTLNRTTWSPSGFTAVFDLVVSMFTFFIICLGEQFVYIYLAN